jgi:outer membrane receptor for ferrienterochelin and colicins
LVTVSGSLSGVGTAHARSSIVTAPSSASSRSCTYSALRSGSWSPQQVRPALLFLNAENVTDVRQTRYDPLLMPTPGEGGRWTPDEWAPLEGRLVNLGVRIGF